MNYSDSRNIIKWTFIALLIAFTMYIRLPSNSGVPIIHNLSNGLLYSVIYLGIFVGWGVSIRRRIIQEQTLRLVLIVTGLMIFWFMTRTIKYQFIIDQPALDRLFWYAYYIPMLLIPLITVLIALTLGKTETYRLSPWIRLLYLPTIILILTVLTNDLHQLVFKFPQGLTWSSNDYEYGPLYWPVLFMMTAPILVSIVITVLKSRVPTTKRVVILPFIPYFIGLAYGVLYVLKVPVLRDVAGDMTAIFCLLLIAIYESLIVSGLIRSNDNYETIFYNANLRARIHNQAGQVVYATGLDFISDSTDMRTSTFPIRGGTVVWQEDIGKINRLIEELAEVNASLAEEHDLLRDELELKERTAKVDEKARLYARINQETAVQRERLWGLLENSEPASKVDSAAVRQQLLRIGFAGTFVKRKSNLLIQLEDQDQLPALELAYALRESLEVLEYGDITTSLQLDASGDLEGHIIIAFYELFEEVIEASLECINAVKAGLVTDNRSAVLSLSLGCENGEGLTTEGRLLAGSLWQELGSQVSYSRDGDDVRIRIELVKAGESS